MSPLTKILTVLLAFSTFFLCAMVVTYVGNADNYKQKYEQQRSELDAAKQTERTRTQELKEKTDQTDTLQQKLAAEIASLQAQRTELEGKLNQCDREKSQLLERVNKWAAVTENFTQTTTQQREQFEKTFEELKLVRADQIKLQKDLDETTSTLIEKMAIIADMESQVRRLAEEKTDLQNKLEKVLQPVGEVVPPPAPVTPQISEARPRTEVTEPATLKGLVTNVDLKNALAEISLGKADGVKEGMTFHVSRGDEYICDILILNVDAEQAVGVLELVREQKPRVGDAAATKL